MLMPFLSVTAIGLVVGTAGLVLRGGNHALLRAFLGSWAGFAAAALVGLILDVTTRSGHWVPLLGHLGALAGSLASQWLEFSAEEGAGA
jgi:hypothetical protein